MSDSYRIKESSIHGLGVFATTEILPMQKIGEFTGEIISRREVRRLTAEDRIHIFEFFGGGHAMHIQNDLRYLNHSSTPNACLLVSGDRLEIFALAAIEPGEELTMDYGPSARMFDQTLDRTLQAC